MTHLSTTSGKEGLYDLIQQTTSRGKSTSSTNDNKQAMSDDDIQKDDAEERATWEMWGRDVPNIYVVREIKDSLMGFSR